MAAKVAINREGINPHHSKDTYPVRTHHYAPPDHGLIEPVYLCATKDEPPVNTGVAVVGYLRFTECIYS